MSRLHTFWSRLYYPLCWIAVAAQLASMIRCNLHLVVPREVGGTLFGGSMDFMLYLGGWALSVIGLGLAVLTRVPGARLAWIIGGLVQLLLGLWWRINYPDDFDGNLTFSIQARELDYVMVFGFALAYSGIYLLRQQRFKPRPHANAHELALRTLWALLLAGFFIPPLVNASKPPLPHCAFNKAGEQLSACLLGTPEERVIVD
ncbi:hypothetical protein GV819_31440 [Pseudomonas sp. Fl5BN2]|uniref:hypothetical protein n=1 Tax=unclassified Pseudomonas TaxID=196821 RepID=UPI0013783A02|nr:MULTISPECIES: hypothetical protein [unclassified Pseudomonas]NBF06790.1 hypothetical protein [Pseudomonas sp. Fl5BN2]NBF12619.1 hypothetical protein [Pseudomonas sp. Fl4BN1]